MPTDVPSPSSNEFGLRLAWPDNPGSDADADGVIDAPTAEVAPQLAIERTTPGATDSELAALRHAVEELADRVELRQIRASIDELRSDVVGLRRAVLEWPELERVSSDITGLHSDMTAVVEGIASLVAAAPDAPNPTPPVGAMAPLIEELGLLRTEVVALKRRVGLRAEGAPVTLDDAQLDRLADAVAARLAPPSVGGRSGRRR